ncbi:MAG: hypothetical protein ACRYGR_08335 [Janthinobacterium lividum]
MYKSILLMLGFSIIGYSSFASSTEVDYLTNRVAQSLYTGGNIRKTEILDICNEMKLSKLNIDPHLEFLKEEEYADVLSLILENKSGNSNWKKSSDTLLNILRDIKKHEAIHPTVVDSAFISIVEKLSN